MMTSKPVLSIFLIIVLSFTGVIAGGASDYNKALDLIKEGEIDKAGALLLPIAENESGDIGSAALDLAGAIGIGGNDADGLYIYGLSLLKMADGDYTNAIDILKKADFKGGLKEYGLETLGRCYQKKLMWEEALNIYRTLYKSASENRKPWYLFYQWQILTMKGDDKKAKEILNILKESYPEFTGSDINK
jgi:tetratricopeptide (TPR) repeat protein